MVKLAVRTYQKLQGKCMNKKSNKERASASGTKGEEGEAYIHEFASLFQHLVYFPISAPPLKEAQPSLCCLLPEVSWEPWSPSVAATLWKEVSILHQHITIIKCCHRPRSKHTKFNKSKKFPREKIKVTTSPRHYLHQSYWQDVGLICQ